eukprot:763116-Hanusia_phi.AAC.1
MPSRELQRYVKKLAARWILSTPHTFLAKFEERDMIPLESIKKKSFPPPMASMAWDDAMGGQRVELVGLENEQWNGLRGRALCRKGAKRSEDSRILVLLDNGTEAFVKRGNLRNLMPERVVVRSLREEIVDDMASQSKASPAKEKSKDVKSKEEKVNESIMSLEGMPAVCMSEDAVKSIVERTKRSLYGLQDASGNVWVIDTKQDILIGRSANCGVVLNEKDCKSVSGYHCIIRYDVKSDVFKFKDISSKGSTINSVPIRWRQVTLNSGDLIQIGGEKTGVSFMFKFFSAEVQSIAKLLEGRSDHQPEKVHACNALDTACSDPTASLLQTASLRHSYDQDSLKQRHTRFIVCLAFFNLSFPHGSGGVQENALVLYEERGPQRRRHPAVHRASSEISSACHTEESSSSSIHGSSRDFPVSRPRHPQSHRAYERDDTSSHESWTDWSSAAEEELPHNNHQLMLSSRGREVVRRETAVVRREGTADRPRQVERHGRSGEVRELHRARASEVVARSRSGAGEHVAQTRHNDRAMEHLPTTQPQAIHTMQAKANPMKLNLERIQKSSKTNDAVLRQDLSELYRYKNREKVEAQKRQADIEDLKKISQKCNATIDEYDERIALGRELAKKYGSHVSNPASLLLQEHRCCISHSSAFDLFLNQSEEALKAFCAVWSMLAVKEKNEEKCGSALAKAALETCLFTLDVHKLSRQKTKFIPWSSQNMTKWIFPHTLTSGADLSTHLISELALGVAERVGHGLSFFLPLTSF